MMSMAQWRRGKHVVAESGHPAARVHIKEPLRLAVARYIHEHTLPAMQKRDHLLGLMILSNVRFWTCMR